MVVQASSTSCTSLDMPRANSCSGSTSSGCSTSMAIWSMPSRRKVVHITATAVCSGWQPSPSITKGSEPSQRTIAREPCLWYDGGTGKVASRTHAASAAESLASRSSMNLNASLLSSPSLRSSPTTARSRSSTVPGRCGRESSHECARGSSTSAIGYSRSGSFRHCILSAQPKSASSRAARATARPFSGGTCTTSSCMISRASAPSPPIAFCASLSRSCV
mmetsp:Transcript_50499/g.167270  ORF Transcript_50499/g.167270 Transcript_50499/m.167270 type:complete len:220 (+) Transcript_50499:311-970(+)